MRMLLKADISQETKNTLFENLEYVPWQTQDGILAKALPVLFCRKER